MESVASLSLLVGLGVSVYAVYIEHQAEVEENYEAMCDISERVSCSKVLASEYSKIWSAFGLVAKGSVLDQSNAFYGLFFYLVVGLVFWRLRRSDIGQLLLLSLSTAAMVLCAFLSYILAEVIHAICLVCYATYLVNFLLFACFSFMYVKPVPSSSKKVQ